MPAPASCACGRQWRGLAEAHCPNCHAHFSRVSAFDAHRPGVKGCVDPATLRKAGQPMLEGKVGPFGVTWTFAGSDRTEATFTGRKTR